MNIDQASLARRLKKARESSGVSQEAAAEALGLPRTAIVHLEAGNRSVSTLQLVDLARLYQRDIAWFFSEEEPEADENALLTLYRIDSQFREDPCVQEAVSKCIELCLEGTALEEMLDVSRRAGPPAYRLDEPRNVDEAVQQGEWVAAQERNRVGIGDAPVVDMADLITNQGVWAAEVELPDQMSGLFLQHRSIGIAVLVNYGHHRNRRRFSYAHEYGHCLMDRDECVTVTRPENQTNLHEMRANAFGAAFLMPERGVASYLNSIDKGGATRKTLHVVTSATQDSADPAEDAIEAQTIEAPRRPAPGSQRIVYQDVAQLACHFKVSYKSAVYRLKNLDWISPAECDELLNKDGHAASYLRILRLIDEDSDEPRRPNRHIINSVAYLAVEAFRRAEISRGKLLEIGQKLGIEGHELSALAKAASA